MYHRTRVEKFRDFETIHIGKRIKYWQKKSSITMDVLAAELRVSRQTVYSRMKSQYAYFGDVMKYCRIFNCTMSEFLGIEIAEYCFKTMPNKDWMK